MTLSRWIALVGALVLAAIAGLAIGAVHVPLGDIVRALAGGGDETVGTIIRDIRLPRVVLGIGAGAALAMSGVTLQGDPA